MCATFRCRCSVSDRLVPGQDSCDNVPYTSCPVEWMKDIAISVAPLSDSFHPLNSDSFCVACARFGMCLRDSARAFVFPALFSQRYLSVVLETLLFPPVTSAVAAHKRELLCTT